MKGAVSLYNAQAALVKTIRLLKHFHPFISHHLSNLSKRITTQYIFPLHTMVQVTLTGQVEQTIGMVILKELDRFCVHLP